MCATMSGLNTTLYCSLQPLVASLYPLTVTLASVKWTVDLGHNQDVIVTLLHHSTRWWSAMTGQILGEGQAGGSIRVFSLLSKLAGVPNSVPNRAMPGMMICICSGRGVALIRKCGLVGVGVSLWA